MKSRTRFVPVAIALMLAVFVVFWFGDLTAPAAIESDGLAVAPEPAPKVDVNELMEPLDSELEVQLPETVSKAADLELPEAAQPEVDFWKLLRGRTNTGFHRFELELEVLGMLGRPLAGSFVCLGPERQPLNMIGRVGGDGKLTVNWSGHVNSMTVVYAVCGPQRSWSGLKSINLVAGGAHQVQVTLPGEQFTIQKGKSPGGKSTRTTRSGKVQPVQSRFFKSPAAVHKWGEVEFVWSEAGSESSVRKSGGSIPDAVAFQRQGDNYSMESYGFIHEEMESFALGLISDDQQPQTITVTGRVLDGFLEPAEGALVTVGYSKESPRFGAKTDSNGEFSIWGIDPRICYVWAGGGDVGTARMERSIDLGSSDVGELVLDRGIEMEGELLTPDKRPLAGWMVECEGVGIHRTESSFTRTGSDGRYRLSNVPDSKLLLHFRPYDSRRIIPSKTVPVNSRHLFQSAESKGTKAGYQDFHILAPRSEDLDGAELRIWGEERGVWGNTWGQSYFRSPALSEGPLRVEAFSLAGGWARKTKFEAKPGRAASLVRLELSGGGTIDFVGDRKPERSYVLWLIGPIVNTRMKTANSQALGRMDLPAGEYELEVHSELKGNMVIPFSLPANAEVVIEIPD
ncbi:MAG: hypothetical protein ACI8TQ_001019 [Planctomycetota bacterium]|jgi:hypothetical protein